MVRHLELPDGCVATAEGCYQACCRHHRTCSCVSFRAEHVGTGTPIGEIAMHLSIGASRMWHTVMCLLGNDFKHHVAP